MPFCFALNPFGSLSKADHHLSVINMGPYGAHHVSANKLASHCTRSTSSMGPFGALHADMVMKVWHSGWLRCVISREIILSVYSMGPYGAHHASANR